MADPVQPAGSTTEVILRNKVRVTLPANAPLELGLLRQKAVEAFAALLAGDASELDLVFTPVAPGTSDARDS